jgi:hypothetical protein
LPPLDDPRGKDVPKHLPETIAPTNPIEKWAKSVEPGPAGSDTQKGRTLNGATISTLPPRSTSAMHGRRVASSPLASPSIGSSSGIASQNFQSLQPTPRSASASMRAPPPYAVRQSLQTVNSGATIKSRFPRGRGPPSLAFMMSHPMIQSSLLPFLSINSFLSLLSTGDDVRRQFTGETVGRWVMREWGIQVERERGRSWPGLTVWEGFCESSCGSR